ncbi:MAG TPA: hypothetical protein VF040_04300 [Ktedonobacterales bacterium]
MNRSQKPFPFSRCYRAPLPLTDGQVGTWYGEYDGIFPVREFVIRLGNRAAVAPFEMPFRGPDHPTEPPALASIAPVSLQEFEALWEQFAQPRLHALAVTRSAPVSDASIRYFRSPFPAEFKAPEATSDIYTEYAAGVARRSFEVFTDHTLVAPYDVGIPEVDVDDVLLAAREGRLAEGELIDPRLRPEEMSHAVFEALWEEQALPRLRVLADNAASTPTSMASEH